MQTSLTADSQTSQDDPTFARVLVPIDFSVRARRALSTALVLRRRLGSEVHLFHLADVGENDEFLAGIGGDAVSAGDLVVNAKERLLRFVDNLFPGQAGDVTVHARMGTDVVHGIERMARDLNATLVLLAGRRRETLFRTDLEKIVRELDGAVLLLSVPEVAPTS